MAGLLTHNQILLAPHITEKSVRASAREGARVYTFKVHPAAGKQEIGKAVRVIYGVHPIRVNLIKVPGKSVKRRKSHGRTSGYKKAMVYIKEGETIQFV